VQVECHRFSDDAEQEQGIVFKAEVLQILRLGRQARLIDQNQPVLLVRTVKKIDTKDKKREKEIEKQGGKIKGN
jgi:hypothetical protein